MDLRFSIETWARIGYGWAILGGGAAVVPALLAGRGRPYSVLIPILAIAALAPPVVFTNFYVIHDYYFVAVSPAIAGLVGLLAANARSERASRYVAPIVIGLAMGTLPYWSAAFDPGSDPDDVRGPAAQIAAVTLPTERVAIRSRDWSPAIHFLADRRGMMIGPWVRDDELPDYRVFTCLPGTGSCIEDP